MALKIRPLHVGTLTGFTRAAVTYQRGYTDPVDVVVLMFLITGGEHPVLVDTGTGTPEQARELHGIGLTRPPEQEPLAALAAAGVDPAEIKTVVNTHLHWDHCSNNDLFPNARIFVQKSELAYAVDPLEPNLKTYERRPGTQPGWVRAIGAMSTVAGDAELLPGISLVHLPGHTPGSQGVLVRAGNTSYLIAGDCVSCQANWDGDELVSHIPSGGFTNLHDYMDSFAKIERLDCVVIPSHDPVVLEHEIFQ